MTNWKMRGEGGGMLGCVMHGLRGLMRVLMLMLAAAPCLGQGPGAPDLMPYQGTMVNGDGQPLGSPTPKNYDVVFRIFDAASGGELLWSEQQTVTVDDGRFSVQLGRGSGLVTEPRPALGSIFRTLTASERYVETTVKGIGPERSDSTMVPRTRLLSGPYVYVTQHAFAAERLINSSQGGVVSVKGTRVGINSTNPVTELDVVGSTRAASLQVNGDSLVRGVATAPSWTGGGAAPVGSVIMWSGSLTESPEGWALCDGRVVNGYRTPDLRGRFVLGAGQGPGLAERSVGDVGGAETGLMTEAEIPSHRHDMGAESRLLASSGSHSHEFYSELGGFRLWAVFRGKTPPKAYGNSSSFNRRSVFTGNSGPHRHEVNLPPTTSNSTGRGLARPNMPPFYVLAYLVRVR